jgi:ceramide glucosyltransferase
VDHALDAASRLWLIFALLATIGCAYQLFAVACLGAFRRRLPPLPALSPLPSVSVLKPLCGAEPDLLENLASFVRQDYAGQFEVLFGVHDHADAAVNTVRRLMKMRPAVPCRLIINPALSGPNRKVSNLANLSADARGEVILAADSDMRVGPSYLSSVIASLCQEGVGLVSCLYRGVPAGGLWSRLAAMAIDYHFLPSVLAGLRLGLAQPCFGATIALRREVLSDIGGFAAFAKFLADDYALGRAVRGLGFRVAIPALILDHSCAEASFRDLFAHELRWARTIRSLDPWGYAGSAVMHPLAFALLSVLSAPGRAAVGLLLASLACRFALQLQVDRVLGRGTGGAWWGPVRDLLSFAVFIASFWPGPVRWRDQRYRMRRDGTLA